MKKIYLQMTEGRQPCEIHCADSCTKNGISVAIATIHWVSGVPLIYPIRKVDRGTTMPRSKGHPSCKDCAATVYLRWISGQPMNVGEFPAAFPEMI